MAPDDAPNSQQIAYWNETAGPIWVAMQDALDAELRTLGVAAMDVLAPRRGERLIDVGCGCGDTTTELARRVGPQGSVVGVDISAPMLDVARRRAAAFPHASFLQADAQTFEFKPADGAFSRFGVMFFEDPPRAFANIRKALAPAGRLVFVCWRALAENAWMTTPLTAILPLLPAPPQMPAPGAPGPFAFADGERVRAILAQAGYGDIVIAAHDEKVGWGDLETSIRVALHVGAVGVAAREYPHLRERLAEAVRGALAPHVTPKGVKLQAGVWIVSAKAG
jgi:SAM-dependent methyltransferase